MVGSALENREVVVGTFPDYTIRVSAQDMFLKVLIAYSSSGEKRVTWIPLHDDDAYDCVADLKIS
jgi:hypothetical protein